MSAILYPIVTEKTTEDIKKGKYTFKVWKDADKREIKKSIEKIYGVSVLDVATINVKEKKRRTMMRRVVTKPAYKKAVVKIKSGQKIDILATEKK